MTSWQLQFQRLGHSSNQIWYVPHVRGYGHGVVPSGLGLLVGLRGIQKQWFTDRVEVEEWLGSQQCKKTVLHVYTHAQNPVMPTTFAILNSVPPLT